MNPLRISSRLFLAIGASLLPLGAQTPLFSDGTAFGGSRVFSEGRNPLGNPARFNLIDNGTYLSYLDGNQRAKDNRSLLEDVAGLKPGALEQLQNAPWAQRTKAYGVIYANPEGQVGYTREDRTGLTAFPDLDPAHAGALNGTWVQGLHTSVDRLHLGFASTSTSTTGSPTTLGATFRLERWRAGVRTAALNPNGDQLPMTGLDDSLLGATGTSQKALTLAVDLGLTTEIAQGLRLGLMVDQLNAKRLWDVDMGPQTRAGLQLDLGAGSRISVETDLNPAARMPFSQKQKASSASLRIQTSQAVVLLLGAERRKVGDATVTQGGITLQVHAASFMVGLGFQLGQDSPLRGATLMVR